MAYGPSRSLVLDRGEPPTSFLDELVDWGRAAPDDIFAVNQRSDIYSSVVDQLGPWQGPVHRRAAMMEVLRVLGGFESSWNWMEGRDTNNQNSNTACTEEAGIFQCSGDSMHFDRSLQQLFQSVSRGKNDCDTFRRVTKTNHTFAIEYCARLLRFTTDHHGPIKDGHVHAWLRRAAVAEFEALLLAPR